jgi:hypothetical protein
MARCLGDYKAARAFLEEDLSIGRELNIIQIIVHCTVSLARVALKEGDLEQVVALCRESLAIRRESRDLPGIADCFEVLAVVVRVQGRLERSAQLSGKAAALRETTRSVLQEPDFRIDYAHHLAALREALGEEAFGSAWTQGRSVSLEQAITEVLEAQ